MITITTEQDASGNVLKSTVWLEEGALLAYLVASAPTEKQAITEAKQVFEAMARECEQAINRLSRSKHGGRRVMKKSQKPANY